jgi:glycosyltransferase involved in cell wall biosynthesis
MKLSIVIPVYNEQARLSDCIKYLEGQTVKPEVIFVDGGSRDNTVGAIKEAMKNNKNFRLAAEKGPSEAWPMPPTQDGR